MHKKRKTKSKVQNTTAKNIAIKTAIGSGVSLVVFFLLALLAGFVFWKNDADINAVKYVIFESFLTLGLTPLFLFSITINAIPKTISAVPTVIGL